MNTKSQYSITVRHLEFHRYKSGSRSMAPQYSRQQMVDRQVNLTGTIWWPRLGSHRSYLAIYGADEAVDNTFTVGVGCLGKPIAAIKHLFSNLPR